MPGYEIFGVEEKKEISDVLQTGVLFRYEFADQRNGIYKVREFEEKFASYCGVGFAQAVTSGTSALKVALTALGVGVGDEVITQGFTFVATWEAIFEVGAIPVFTEIDETLNMDPVDLEKKITDKTKCIIPVHMLGAQARIEEIVAIAEKYNIPVLEDTAQAAGARIHEKHLGTFGRCGTFSFDAVKTITTGEGGMIVTDDKELWRSMSEYHDHGHDHAVNPGGRGGEGRRFIGFNFRMMELQGAIGIAQLAKLDTILAAQRKNKFMIMEAVSSLPGVWFRKLVDPEGDSATFCCFMFESSEHCRKINSILSEYGVGAINFSENTWHFYPKWEHLQAGSTLNGTGWPFMDQEGRRRVIYDIDRMPVSADIMSRTLVYQVPVKMSETWFAKIGDAVQKAAKI